MRWYKASTYKRVQVGTDETHNPIFDIEETGDSISVRSALYSPTHDPAEGNQFSMVHRTFLTRARPELLQDIVAIEVQGILYEIEGMTYDALPVAIRVKRSKDGIQAR